MRNRHAQRSLGQETTIAQTLAGVDRHDVDDYLPWSIDGVTYGHVRKALRGALAEHPQVFDIADGGVRLHTGLRSYAERTRAFHEVMLDWRNRGLLHGWWGEPNPVVEDWGRPAVMEVERAALDPFGIRGFGVHLNGYVRSGQGIAVWIGRRARTKSTFPGQLDNIAAGGLVMDLDLDGNVRKEAEEEAGIGPAYAAALRPVGAIDYRCALETGLNDDTLFLYDLELPADFVPQNQDGEIESFELWSPQRLVEHLRRTDEFKFNVAPVILDFLVRHELLPESDPEFEAVRDAVAHLRRLRR